MRYKEQLIKCFFSGASPDFIPGPLTEKKIKIGSLHYLDNFARTDESKYFLGFSRQICPDTFVNVPV